MGSGSRRSGNGAVPVPKTPGHRAMARSSRSRSPPSIFPADPGQRQLWLRQRQKPQPLLLPPPSRPIKSRLEPLEPPALTARSAGTGQEAGASLICFSGAKCGTGGSFPTPQQGTGRRVHGPWLGTSAHLGIPASRARVAGQAGAQGERLALGLWADRLCCSPSAAQPQQAAGPVPAAWPPASHAISQAPAEPPVARCASAGLWSPTPRHSPAVCSHPQPCTRHGVLPHCAALCQAVPGRCEGLSCRGWSMHSACSQGGGCAGPWPSLWDAGCAGGCAGNGDRAQLAPPPRPAPPAALSAGTPSQ